MANRITVIVSGKPHPYSLVHLNDVPNVGEAVYRAARVMDLTDVIVIDGQSGGIKAISPSPQYELNDCSTVIIPLPAPEEEVEDANDE